MKTLTTDRGPPTYRYPILTHSMEVQTFTTDRGPPTLAMSIASSRFFLSAAQMASPCGVIMKRCSHHHKFITNNPVGISGTVSGNSKQQREYLQCTLWLFNIAMENHHF